MIKTRSEKLQEAIRYEGDRAQEITKDARPSFHVTAPVGWMNDPNGFSEYQGAYHLFYQYHPYDTHWGPMHWGHTKTSDFIKWEQLPCALAPDTPYDGQGCFSGSAVEDDGRHILLYTSVKVDEDANGERRERQTQSIAIGDGVHYEKLEQNPVITADMLPEGSSKVDFRDPKMWKENDTFYTVVGSRNEDGSGQIALFSSKDVQNWKYEKILAYCHNEYGKMWECPDFFPLDGKQILIVSPQSMEAEQLEFHSGNNSVYFVGDYDCENLEFSKDEAHQIDFGMDFYAPQTMQTSDGRRIMIGWLNNWDNYLTPDDMEWSGMMTIPRELSIRDGRLIQNPVRELADYHAEKAAFEKVQLKTEDGFVSLDGVKGRSFDMTVELEGGDYETFSILLACDQKHYTELMYNQKKGTFTTDRTYSGMTKDLLSSRSMQVKVADRCRIRIIMDKYSIEVFVNDGEYAMTSLIYTGLDAEQIKFGCEGKATFSVEKYDIMV